MDAYRFSEYVVLTCAECPYQMWTEKPTQEHVPGEVMDAFLRFNFAGSPAEHLTDKNTAKEFIYSKIVAGSVSCA